MNSLRPRRRLRADIQALRALAVLAVLAYHLWPHALTGGYVGVDVFFVISGFLITSHLVRELEQTGTIRVGQFWARRAKRLLPAALIVLLAIAAATIILVPATRWVQYLTEVGAASVYVQNWLLAAQSVDYLAGAADPSPVQHFWTLSVEEQFYLVVPLLLLAAAALSRRRGALVALAALTVASFAYGVWFTDWSTAAYFSTLTRAWEFGIGALVAFLPAVTRGRNAIALAGVAAIALAAVLYTGQTPFPGTAALLPVVGTAVAIWAGQRSILTGVGELRPVAMVGRISYSLYLWHWPLIVLVPFVSGAPLTLPQKLGIIVASLGLAWLSTTLVEDPIRNHRRLLGQRRPRTVAAWAAGGMALVLSVSVSACTVQAQEIEETIAAAPATMPPVDLDSAECVGAQTMDADLDCTLPERDGFVTSLAAVAEDDPNRDECWSGRGVADFDLCTLGAAEEYSKHLLVIGDSHSSVFLDVWDDLGTLNGWRVDLAGHAGCYLTTATLNAPDAEARQGCDGWRAAALEHVAAADVDAIIVTRSIPATLAIPVGGESGSDAQIRGLVEAWAVRDPSIPLLAIVDNPVMPAATFACLETHGPDDAAACDQPRDDVLRHDLQRDAVEQTENAHLVDLTGFYCTEITCPAVIGDVVVYRPDGNHVTGTYAATLAPYLERSVVELTGD
ncbi:acyltransferase family protein [Agromyces sp. SYSU T00194]|uniref:acyltransferase family protein n=1 Tax=Agromyces chitinivorans TaxID=3158560 RepID=UPI00339A404F